MIIGKKTVEYFLCQAKLLDWHSDIKYTTKYLSGRNNNIFFLNSQKSFFLKQSMTENTGVQEGVLQEVYFYSWLKILSNDFIVKHNFIHFVGYEPRNKILVFELKKDSQAIDNKQLTISLLDEIVSMLFCFYHVKWQNEFPIIVRDKPDIWKIINEEPTTDELPKQWFEVRNYIKTRFILLQLLDELLPYWKPEFICNADIKLDNFLIEKGTNQIYWIDWERFCLADELWDVGGLLRIILFEHLKINKDLNLVVEDSIFQQRVSQIWGKIYSINSSVSKEKLLSIWIASILEKTLELTQEEAIKAETAYFLVEICENMQARSDKIKNLFN